MSEAALIAILFAINAYAPKPPAPMQANAPGFDRTTIRITSNRVADDPIVYDTSQPTIVPPARVAQTKPVETSVATKNDGTGTKAADARVEAMAQVDTPAKPTASKPKPKQRKIRAPRPSAAAISTVRPAPGVGATIVLPQHLRQLVRSILEPHFGSERGGEGHCGPLLLLL